MFTVAIVWLCQMCPPGKINIYSVLNIYIIKYITYFNFDVCWLNLQHISKQSVSKENMLQVTVWGGVCSCVNL